MQAIEIPFQLEKLSAHYKLTKQLLNSEQFEDNRQSA